MSMQKNKNAAVGAEPRDPLYETLHADHEEVTQLFEQLLANDSDEIEALWKDLATKLTAHARAESEVVYGRFDDENDLSDDIREAQDAHDRIEQLLSDADAQGVGTEAFQDLVDELDDLVRSHVDEEEGEVLPQAAGLLGEPERARMADRFDKRKQEILPGILEEWGLSRGRERATGAKVRGAPAAARTVRRGPLEDRKLGDLREMAREQGIRGRSRMNKKDLVKALKKNP